MTTGITIYRRDGTIAFVADTASTMREAVEQAAKSGAYLTRADLALADLQGANLDGANLAYANLQGATLSHATLAHADLSRAYLYGANLTGAYLTRANFYGANLTGANLTGADLSGAYFTGAYGVHHATIGPIDGWMVALTLTPVGLRISAGCRYFSFPEAREHWSDPGRWSEGASPEHGARMLAAVDALMALTVDWPEKLPEAGR